MPRRILLADNDASVRDRIGALLSAAGHRIETSDRGAAALERVRGSTYELILAGTTGGLDELAFLRQARAIRRGAKIILLGPPDPRSAVAAMACRAYSYFHKPLSENALVDMVRRAVEASTWERDLRLVSALPDWLSLSVRCTLYAAERAVQFVREAEITLPGSASEQVAAAFRELLLNAVEHGGGLDPRKYVRAALIRTANALVGSVQDPGPGFSLDCLPHAAISNPGGSPIRHAEIRACLGQRPGGFGILMCRSMVDELRYSERGNQVLFVKYLK